MGARIELIEEIRARIDLTRLISDYVPLRKSGRRYLGLCPFHHENTPSFSVNPEGRFFYCFGCKASGDSFDFIMRIEGLDFTAAAKLLAERAGLVWEHQTPEEAARGRRRDALLRLNTIAAEIYRRALAAPCMGLPARDYLRARGTDLAASARFRLGYAPRGGRTLVEVFRRHGYRLEDASTIGLVLSSSGGYVDRFRDRLIFPLIDLRDRVIGFGGRAIGDGQPKYLNSSESELFKKGQFLYGLNPAREPIRRAGQAILVEGYMDVITSSLAGVANTVAPLGTALTQYHAELLKRYTGRVVIAFDGDTAGQTATVRGLAMLKRAGLAVYVAVLPPGQDPDDLVRKEGGGTFESLVAAALPLTEFLIVQALSGADLSHPESRNAAVQACLPVLTELAPGAECDGYIRMIASRTRVHEDRVQYALSIHSQSMRKGHHIMDNAMELSNTIRCDLQPPVASPNPAEKELLRAILKEYSLLARIKEVLKPEDFAPGVLHEIYVLILEQPGPLMAESLFQNATEQAQPMLRELFAEAESDHGPPLHLEALPKCIGRVKEGALSRQLLEVEAQLESLRGEDDDQTRRELQRRQLTLRRELDESQGHSGFGGAY